MPIADAETLGQRIDPLFADPLLGDEAKGATDRGRSPEPRQRVGGCIRPTAGTGSIARRFGAGRAGEKRDVVFSRHGGRAPWSTVKARRAHGDHESPVKAPVAARDGVVAHGGVEVHGVGIVARAGRDSPFSDLVACSIAGLQSARGDPITLSAKLL
jgi:hypothetical protein